KWLMHSQGVSEQTLTDIFKSSEHEYNEKQSNSNATTGEIAFRGARLIDLSGAIDRMTDDFNVCRVDILHCFAESDGKIIAQLDVEYFSKQLYTVTEKVSKTDIQVSSHPHHITTRPPQCNGNR